LESDHLEEFYIILNPSSGAGRGERFLPLLSQFAQSNGGHILVSQFPGHSTELAKSVAAKGRLIFAAGGDDTVREVLQGIHTSKSVLGILPLGTFNNLATSLYLPPDPLECLSLSVDGGVNCKIDLGKIENGPLFTESIGIGLDAHAWSKAPRKEPVGIGRWIMGLRVGLASILDFTPQNYTLEIDGQRQKVNDVLQITVANSRCYCSGVQIAPNAKMNDGLLDICIVSRLNKLKFLLMTPLFYFGRHINSSTSVRYIQAQKITIAGPKHVAVRVDGVLASWQPPLKAMALSNSLTIRLPARCRYTNSLLSGERPPSIHKGKKTSGAG